MDDKQFKKCPCCELWFSAHEIIHNPDCRLEGMCLDGEDISLNMFIFTHMEENCYSSFAILATEFAQFMDEKPDYSVLAGSPTCEGHCLDINDKSECHKQCFWSHYRTFMRKMLELKKNHIGQLVPPHAEG